MASGFMASSQCRSRAGSPTRSADQPSTPVTDSPSTRNESAVSAPLITVGWNCHTEWSATASRQRSRSAAGSLPVAAADSISAAVEDRHSAAERTGSPASPTKLVGSVCMAAMAWPIDPARPSPGGTSSTATCSPGRKS